MNTIRIKRRRLHRLLRAVHRQKQAETMNPEPGWRQGVMIRLGAANGRAAVDPWAVMARLVWRFVPAAGALALFLIVLISRAGTDTAGEVARILSGDSADAGLYAFYQNEAVHE